MYSTGIGELYSRRGVVPAENLFTISSGLALRRREPPFAGWY